MPRPTKKASSETPYDVTRPASGALRPHEGGDDVKGGMTQRRVLQAFDGLARGEAQTAETIHARLAAQGFRCVTSGVYRAMTKLADTGVLERHDTAGGSAVFTVRGDRPRTAYLCCQSCGRALGLHDDPLRARLQAVARRLGFVAADRAVTLRGHCEACVAASWVLRAK